MSKVKIRMNKRIYWILIFLFTTFSFTTIYIVYLTDIVSERILIQYTTLPLMLAMLFYTYKLTAKLISDEPEIILTKDSIEIRNFTELDRSKLTNYKWSEIKDLKIETINNKSSLTIWTDFEKKTFNISGLERTPDEIQELIRNTM
jgi:hypothetical protein